MWHRLGGGSRGEADATVWVSHLPPRGGGGPHGVLHTLLSTAVAERAQKDGRLFLFAADSGPDGVQLTGLRRERAVLRLLWRLRHRRLYVVSFGLLRGVALARFLPGGSIRIAYTEHSKGGVHHEWRAAGVRRRGVHRVMADTWLSCLLAHELVFPSQAALELFRRRNAWFGRRLQAKVRIVYNGVPDRAIGTAPAASATEGSITLLSIAQEVRDKGVADLIERVVDVRRRGVDVRLTLVGGRGEESPRVDELVEAAGPSVERLGPVSAQRIMELMQSSDALIHLPKVAVFDLVVLEAMAAGLPVIASPVGGNVEALGEDYRGYARDGDDLTPLLRWVVDERAAISTSLIARQRRLFTAERMTQEYLRPAAG